MKLRPTLIVVALVASAFAGAAAEPPVILLWPNGAPGSEGKSGEETVRVYENGEHIVSNVHRPSIAVFLPAKGTANGAGVVIVPGGGHLELWLEHEGYNVARFLADHGIAAFVLKYRLAKQKGSTYTVEGNELADLQRAIRLVRSRATEWSVDVARVGVMGFSAGGEVAVLAGTRYDSGAPAAADPVDRSSSRPAFQALIYPSIPPEDLKPAKLSKETPPAFLLSGADDQPRISQGLVDLFLALRQAGASAEIHIYAGVPHGFGLRASNRGPVAAWPQQFLEWLQAQGFTQPR